MPLAMGLILSSENSVDFLKRHNLYPPDFELTAPIKVQESKNFNLVIRSTQHKSFIVKQNRVDSAGKTSGNLFSEWMVQHLVNSFSDLDPIRPLISEVVLFDRADSITVSVFYDEYMALDDYYEESQSYHPKVANLVGANLARIHCATYQKKEYRTFLGRYCSLERAKQLPRSIQALNNLGPNIFGTTCPDGLDFYRLYQRFPSLNHAVLDLYDHLTPSCLTHGDLTLDNLIIDSGLKLDSGIDNIRPKQIKIIDWEFNFWADPANDLGMLVSQYLSEWLDSLVVDPTLDTHTTLKFATCPLENITPSLQALVQGYLEIFPEILDHRCDFIQRVIQFAGIGIIDRLSYYVEYHHYFDNVDICKLQVAKNLLCSPEVGIKTILGQTEAELIKHIHSSSLT
jgi:thiamine kinase-like enzyme